METPKKLLIFSQKKLFLYFGKRKPEKTSIFSQKKLFLYFEKRKPEKIPYISGNGSFLYFRKGIFTTLPSQNFLIFQERNIQNPGITELFLNFRKGIFRNFLKFQEMEFSSLISVN